MTSDKGCMYDEVVLIKKIFMLLGKYSLKAVEEKQRIVTRIS